jgi:hypothetical protein
LRRFEKLVSGCAILVIFWGGVLISHRVWRPDLNREFRKINHRYFADGLHGVRVEYRVLEYDGETRKYSDDGFLILIDTDADISRVLKHESCHIFLPWDDENRNHGGSFQACMRRFK